jgi:hypothetical protein
MALRLELCDRILLTKSEYDNRHRWYVACDRFEAVSSPIQMIWPVRGQGQERRMTLQRGRNAVDRKPAPPENTPRLRLKPKAPVSGYVDGAGGAVGTTWPD